MSLACEWTHLQWSLQNIVLISCKLRKSTLTQGSKAILKIEFSFANLLCLFFFPNYVTSLRKIIFKIQANSGCPHLIFTKSKSRAVPLNYKLFIELQCRWTEHTWGTARHPDPQAENCLSVCEGFDHNSAHEGAAANSSHCLHV